jgi:antitoxin VapB
MPSAKLFTHGGSQAVRLPKEFRFEGKEVHVRRVGQDVVLSAIPQPGPEVLIDALMAFEKQAPLMRAQPEEQVRAELRPAG